MSELERFAQSSEFWSSFVAKHWEKSPAVFPGLFPAPILSPTETFDALTAAFKSFREGGATDRPRCYLDGAEVLDGPGWQRFFPNPSEPPEEYAARMPASFAVVINALHVHSRPLYYRLRGFLRGLYALTGLPATRTDPVLFFGNYAQTPFGIHTDAASVFTFNLSEHPKRVLLWPPRHFTSTLPERALASIDEKTALDQRIGPRDLMYWPSSHWHVAVAEPGLHASLGVGVYFAATQAELLSPVLPLVLSDRRHTALRGTTAALPPELEQALQAAERSQASLRQQLHGEWLRRLTSDGLQPPPPLEQLEPLGPDDRIQLGELGPIMSAPSGDALLVAGNGHSWLITQSVPELSAAIDELNAGGRVRVGPILRKGGAVAAQIHEALIGLVSVQALRKL